MRKGFNSYYRLTAALALAGCISVAMAQEAGVKPRFAVLPAKPAKDAGAPAAALTTWNGSFTYSGTTYKYNMVGTSPKTGATTTVTAVIIPLKFVVTVKGKQYTFDPSTTLPTARPSRRTRSIRRFSTPPPPTCRAASTLAPPNTSMLSSAPISGASFRRTRTITSC